MLSCCFPDLCQGGRCQYRRIGSAWPACHGCDQCVIAKVQHDWATPISARPGSMIAGSYDRRIHPLSRCATKSPFKRKKTGIARLAMPLFPHPTPCSTASTSSTPSTLSTMSTAEPKINLFFSDSYRFFLRDIAQLDYLNWSQITRPSCLYSLLTCLEMRDMCV